MCRQKHTARIESHYRTYQRWFWGKTETEKLISEFWPENWKWDSTGSHRSPVSPFPPLKSPSCSETGSVEPSNQLYLFWFLNTMFFCPVSWKCDNPNWLVWSFHPTAETTCCNSSDNMFTSWLSGEEMVAMWRQDRTAAKQETPAFKHLLAWNGRTILTRRWENLKPN